MNKLSFRNNWFYNQWTMIRTEEKITSPYGDLHTGLNAQVISFMVLSIILLATFLRLSQLSIQSIAFDESFSLMVGLAKWTTLFQAILSDGVHPPLFYVIHKGALALWGVSEFGQRFLAAVLSIVSVALIYWAGRVMFDRYIGLLGALFLALNPLHIWLAQEARMYSLFGVLTIISMAMFWQAIHTRRGRYWAFLAVVNAVIFFLHYFGFLIPTIQFVFIISTFRHNYQNLRRWTVIQLIAVLPLLPWLIATARRPMQTFGLGFLKRPTGLDFFVTLWNLSLGSSNLFWPVASLTIIVVSSVFVVTFRHIPPHRIWLKHARQLLWLWVLLPILITWLVSQRRSFYADRYFSFIIPGLALLFAFGIIRLSQSRWRISLAGAMIVASGYGLVATHLDPAFQKDNWRGAATYIERNEQPEDIVLLYTTHIKIPFDYYYQGDAVTEPLSLNLERFPIEPLVAGHRRAWVVYPYTRRPTHYPMQPLLPNGYWAEDPDRNPELVRWLETHADDITDYQHFRGIQVWLVDNLQAEE